MSATWADITIITDDEDEEVAMLGDWTTYSSATQPQMPHREWKTYNFIWIILFPLKT